MAFKTVVCLGCHNPTLTWAVAKQSFGRMLRAGMTIEEAKAHKTLCAKCTTKLLKGLPSGLNPAEELKTGPI